MPKKDVGSQSRFTGLASMVSRAHEQVGIIVKTNQESSSCSHPQSSSGKFVSERAKGIQQFEGKYTLEAWALVNETYVTSRSCCGLDS